MTAKWGAPTTPRVPVHGCDWVDCPRVDTTRHGCWGQRYWLCAEHGPLVGDDEKEAGSQ